MEKRKCCGIFLLSILLLTGCRTARVNENRINHKEGFFPVYGITLGQTEMQDIVGMCYKCDDGNCSVETLYFWDHDGDQIVESLYMTCYDKLPDKWINNYGFRWCLSYNEWMRVLKKNGFDITVNVEPHVKEYQDRETLSAHFNAVNRKESIVFELSFDYGNDDGEGATTDSAYSLYSIIVNKINSI